MHYFYITLCTHIFHICGEGSISGFRHSPENLKVNLFRYGKSTVLIISVFTYALENM